MLRPMMILVILLAKPAWSKSNDGTIVEVAPLRSAMGFLAVRGEQPGYGNLAFGASYDRLTTNGVRVKGSDDIHRLGGEIVHYPEKIEFDGLFLGAGLTYQKSIVGQRHQRNYATDVRYNAYEQFDTWAAEEQRLLIPIFLGYRHILSHIFTISVKFIYDRDIYTSTSLVEKDIKSYGFDPGMEHRKMGDARISVYLGFNIP